MDLQIIADGEIAMIHDGTVDRTTDGSGRVDEMMPQELRRPARWRGGSHLRFGAALAERAALR
jgi:glycerophosphoryl diester phosphodiesterase